MRPDPKTTKALAANAKHIVANGELIIWLEEPGAVYLHEGTRKALIGTGSYLRRKVAPGAEISANKKASVRDVVQVPRPPKGEVFTNFDKRPGETALEMAVRREARKLAIHKQSQAIQRRKADLENIRRHGLEVPKDKQPLEHPEPNADGSATPPPRKPDDVPEPKGKESPDPVTE